MRVKISEGEWYPVYECFTARPGDWRNVVEMTEDEYVKFEALFVEFSIAQEKLQAFLGIVRLSNSPTIV
jgi:hypothetical protein